MSDDTDTVLSPFTAFGGMTVGNPAAAADYLRTHRARAEELGQQHDDVAAQRQAKIDRATQILDQTTEALKASRSGQSSLPLLAMGAAMLSNRGNFGEQLGAGINAMIPQIAGQRGADADFHQKMAEIALRRAGLEEAPLKDKMAYLRAMQLAELQGVRDVEKAQVRTGVGGQAPALVKEWQVWQTAPGNEGKPLSEYMEWKSRLGSDRNTPALLREFDAWSREPANTGKTIEEYLRSKKGAEASGTTGGKATAEALQNLPGAITAAETFAEMAERLKTHPGLERSLGMGSLLPNLPGGKGADFQAMVDQLKGKAFTMMFDTLRGGGAITEIEGQKATDALAALSLKQSPAQFKKNLDDAMAILNKGLSVARQKAGLEPMRTQPPGLGGAPQPPATAAPSSSASPTRMRNPKTGQVIVLQEGVWVDEKTGKPVQ